MSKIKRIIEEKEVYTITLRERSSFKTLRTPKWVSGFASSLFNANRKIKLIIRIKTGYTETGNLYIQSILIDRRLRDKEQVINWVKKIENALEKEKIRRFQNRQIKTPKNVIISKVGSTNKKYNFMNIRTKGKCGAIPSAETKIIIEGKECKVDKSLSIILKNLSLLGYKPLYSCSGLESEHLWKKGYYNTPYIAFDSRNIKEDEFADAMKLIGWSAVRNNQQSIIYSYLFIDKGRKQTMPKPQFTVLSLEQEKPFFTDGEIRTKFRKLFNMLKNNNDIILTNKGKSGSVKASDEELKRYVKRKRTTQTQLSMRGKEIVIDNSILNIIQNLNKKGYITIYSCSGIKKEHKKLKGEKMGNSYITFDPINIKNKELLKKLLTQIGWEMELYFTFEGITSAHSSLNAYLPRRISDKEKLKRWDLLEKQLLMNSDKILK